MLSDPCFIRLKFSERVIEQFRGLAKSKEIRIQLYNFLNRLNDYCLDEKNWVMIGDFELLNQLKNGVVISYPIICNDGEYMIVLRKEKGIYQITDLVIKPIYA